MTQPPMLATHRPIEDVVTHIHSDHVYKLASSYVDQLKNLQLHYYLHASGLGHREEGV